MFLGLAWHWWLLIAAALIVSIPCKLQFLRWWLKHTQERKKARRGKWGDEE